MSATAIFFASWVIVGFSFITSQTTFTGFERFNFRVNILFYLINWPSHNLKEEKSDGNVRSINVPRG
jgi:hypothetical protein